MRKTTMFICSFLMVSLSIKAQNKNYRVQQIERLVLKINQNLNLKKYSQVISTLTEKKKDEDKNIIVSKKEKQVVKIEYFEKLNEAGSSIAIIIYLRKGIPILIEKEKKDIITARLKENNKHITSETIYKQKVFVKNWNKSVFVYDGIYPNGENVEKNKISEIIGFSENATLNELLVK